jgi:endo-1,4-beta-xylanase
LYKKYAKSITNVTFWGLKDDLSWLNFLSNKRNDFPLLFNRNFRANYAYWGVVAPLLLPVIIKTDEEVCEIISRSNQ